MNKVLIIALALTAMLIAGCRHGDHHYHKNRCPPPRRTHFAPQPNAVHRAGPPPPSRPMPPPPPPRHRH